MSGTGEGAAPGLVPAQVMVHLTETVASNLGLQEVLQRVTDAGTALSGATIGAFFYTVTDCAGRREQRHVLSGDDAASPYAELPTPRVEDLAHSPDQGVDRVDDLTTDPRFSPVPKGHPTVRSYMSMPVVARDGEVVGVLLFGHPKPGVFTAASEDLVRVVSAHAAVAIENAVSLQAETHARLLAEQRARRVELLQEATSAMATALTADEALDALNETVIERLGVARMGVYQRRGPRLDALRTKYPASARNSPHYRWLPVDIPSLTALAAETGRPALVSTREALLERYPEVAAELTDIHAGAAFPMRSSSGAVAGALTLTWTEPRQLDDDVRLLEAVAEQLASTLERTRLYAAEAQARDQLQRHVAELTETSRTLQRALLPADLPASEDVRVAVRYLPAGSGAEVGGDWYDVVVRPDGRIVLVIGDVQGHNLAAAAVMGRVSTALHAYLLEGHPLDLALQAANKVVEQAGVLVTCCLMSLEPETGLTRMVRAGHPMPVYRRADGRAGEVGWDGGPPLGVSGSSVWPVTTGQAQPGDRLVLYTDGLVERADGADATKTLVETVAESDAGDLEELADQIVARVQPANGDDVALLVADFTGTGKVPAASYRVEAACDVARAREFARTRLRRWGDPVDPDMVELLVSEMVTNALVHAGGPADLELRLEAGAVRVEVTDYHVAHLRARHPSAEETGGRGLMLVEAVSQSWGVQPAPAGKTVWARVDS